MKRLAPRRKDRLREELTRQARILERRSGRIDGDLCYHCQKNQSECRAIAFFLFHNCALFFFPFSAFSFQLSSFLLYSTLRGGSMARVKRNNQRTNNLNPVSAHLRKLKRSGWTTSGSEKMRVKEKTLESNLPHHFRLLSLASLVALR